MGRMMLDSIDNGLLVYPTIEENRQTRPKKYSKLTEAQQFQDDCDVQATNIILHGIPLDVYALVNHQEAAKDIWDMMTQQSHAEFPQLDSGLAIPMFQQGDDPIECINKGMAFLQPFKMGNATTSKGNVAAGQPRVVKCYNYQGEEEAGQILDEEQLAFLADPGISEALVAQ
ncbi:hypothetical protein Tco_0417043 [Tanacetum coccineum]